MPRICSIPGCGAEIPALPDDDLIAAGYLFLEIEGIDSEIVYCPNHTPDQHAESIAAVAGLPYKRPPAQAIFRRLV